MGIQGHVFDYAEARPSSTTCFYACKEIQLGGCSSRASAPRGSNLRDCPQARSPSHSAYFELFPLDRTPQPAIMRVLAKSAAVVLNDLLSPPSVHGGFTCGSRPHSCNPCFRDVALASKAFNIRRCNQLIQRSRCVCFRIHNGITSAYAIREQLKLNRSPSIERSVILCK